MKASSRSRNSSVRASNAKSTGPSSQFPRSVPTGRYECRHAFPSDLPDPTCFATAKKARPDRKGVTPPGRTGPYGRRKTAAHRVTSAEKPGTREKRLAEPIAESARKRRLTRSDRRVVSGKPSRVALQAGPPGAVTSPA
ncbi:hypothetical protein GCM10010517_41000 [Streptosporangium fragile]|uniref:Uncharacterized protein n=1 Tax=Streptosporangium fragile TaxID=46186 RepID=A0ABN3W073_9ACTN